MFCPKCGTQNEDGARFCRQCGTALDSTVDTASRGRGPALVGWLLVAVGLGTAFVPDAVVPQEGSKLLAFILLTSGFGLVLSGSSAIRRLGAGAVAAAVIVFPLYYLRSSMPGSTSTDAAGVVMDVEMPVLMADYASNEVAADQRYKGRLIRVHGVVSDIKKDLMDKPFVLLHSGDGFRTVQCAFPSGAAKDVAQLKAGEAVILQGVVQGLMVNVQVTDCAVVRDVSTTLGSVGTTAASTLPNVSAPTTTARSVSADAAAAELPEIVRKVAVLAAESADGSSTGWDQLAAFLPMDHWMDLNDDEFVAAKQVETSGVMVTAKGTRTHVLRTELSRDFAHDGDSDADALVKAFGEAFHVQPIRCDSTESTASFERWYRVSAQGRRPVLVKYEFSMGSAEGSETLTFQASAELPTVGDDAIVGTWSDRCSR